MPSKMDVWNSALAKLGQDVRVSSPNELTKHAKALNVAWDRVLDYVLADGLWPFAVTHAALALVAEPAAGWAYRYDAPNDCITALAVSDVGGIRQYRDIVLSKGVVNGPMFESQYGEQGRTIITDVEGAHLLYVKRVEDTGRFPPLFVEALACRLALDIAPVVAGEIGIRLAGALEEKYAVTRDRAVVHDFNESGERTDFASPTLASRGG